MRNLVVLLVLIAAYTGNAQTSKPGGFTLSQIDSIALKNGRSGIAEGIITSEKSVIREDKKLVIQGEGQSSVAIYLYKTPAFSRLIKGEYHRNVRYEDKSAEEVYAQFYYNEKQLYFIRLTEIINNGKESTTRSHDIDVTKMETLKNSDFLFTPNIQKWIAQHDAEILKLSKAAQKDKDGN